MEIKKEELLEMAKVGGKEITEEALEMAAKKLSHMTIDMLAKIVDDADISMLDVIWAASEDKLEELADKIDVSL